MYSTQKVLYIYLLPLRFPEQELLSGLSFILPEIFRLPVFLLNKPFPLEDGKDSLRNQYNSTWILSQILERVPEEACKVLAVTSVDLYIPVLTYVFGEAQLDGKAAVVSTYRLRDELYGLPPNPQGLKERLAKEAVHELGHTFGLLHCRDPQCVMYTSTYAEEIDFKPVNFCKNCAELLGR
ncbi:MAG: archaemetzincin family Zn-dependent metalloprotease [candidate division KSB1 bacterium]|nr:archaemetzincin family Zn-dependent metalloprotease [candidate division KSB1 bacterium]